jgi:hypothetical protein
MPTRSGQSHAFESPVSGECKGEAYTPNAATGSGGRPAANHGW